MTFRLRQLEEGCQTQGRPAVLGQRKLKPTSNYSESIKAKQRLLNEGLTVF